MFGVYAVCGGTIEGKSVLEWLEIKFGDEYENYKVGVEGQEIGNNETNIKLTGTVCDEGFTVLEFDVKLSDSDKEKLNLGEKMLTEEYMNTPPEELSLTQEEKEEFIKEFGEQLIDEIYLSFNTKFITDDTGTHLDNISNYNITIDGEEFWLRPRAAQSIRKISDNEYIVYQLYFLTDKELGDKKEFTISFNNVVILANYTQFGSEETYIPLDGEFKVSVSKEKALENTRIIENDEEIKYGDMTKKLEKIIDTPLQTIVKINTIYENVSLTRLSNEKENDFIDTVIYSASDENGVSLGTYSYETKRLITYSDGREEEWNPGEIEASGDFENAKMELIEYIIIEKGNSNIKLELKEMNNNESFGAFELNLDK